VFKEMDVKPPMVVSLAKKEELIYVQAKTAPVRLDRNHLGLKLLQYIRDEAHRFAQHYHHILRRKSQLEEEVKQGRRPPRAKRKATGTLTPLPVDENGIEKVERAMPAPSMDPVTAREVGVQATHVRPPESAA
jgi:hypothetical protein